MARVAFDNTTRVAPRDTRRTVPYYGDRNGNDTTRISDANVRQQSLGRINGLFCYLHFFFFFL
jgi:hypothetical protein